MFSFKSLSGKLFWWIFLILVGSFVLIFFQQMVIVNRLAAERVRNNEKLVVSFAVDTLQKAIGEKIERLQGLPENFPSFENATDQEINQVMVEIYKTDPTSGAGNYFFANAQGLIQAHGSPPVSIADRDYFAKARDTRKPYVSDFLVSRNDPNMHITSIAVPFIDSKNQFRGVFVNVVIVNEWMAMLADKEVGSTGYAFLLSSDGVFLYHPDPKLIGQKMSDVLDPELAKQLEQAVLDNEESELRYTYNGTKKTLFSRRVPFTTWGLGATINDEEIFREGTRAGLLTLGLLAGVGAAILIVVMLLMRGLKRKLSRMGQLVETFGSGDLTVSFDGNHGQDEMALMGKSLQKMTGLLRASLSSILEASSDIHRSSEQLSTISSDQAQSAAQLEQQAQGVEGNIQGTSASIQEVSSGVEEVAASAQNVSTLSKELSGEAGKTLQMASDGMGSIRNAVENIEKAQAQTQNTAQVARELAEQAKNVGEIVNTISSIAEQTNLLALNAAIEAARAGEAGKGFAVVADEIRKLAEESKTATTSIAGILKLISQGVTQADKATEDTVELVGKVSQDGQAIGRQFSEISESVQKINTMITNLSQIAETQSAAASEMADAMDASARSTTEVSGEVEGMVQAVQAQKEVGERVDNAAQEIKRLSRLMEEKVSGFRVG
ncbi:MAG TPA: methyl-accepting chemotaxis protein [Thermotogota bacterium]|nr:methyl-accepting chemotaxis protein [Thermotogota bacterium]HRW93861.1 methyl-accepting chemotaxis protein [Thermotogota bacterium]